MRGRHVRIEGSRVHFREITGEDFTAKDFRTRAGTAGRQLHLPIEDN